MCPGNQEPFGWVEYSEERGVGIKLEMYTGASLSWVKKVILVDTLD